MTEYRPVAEYRPTAGHRPEDGMGPVFDALADPTRRWVIDRLAGGGSVTATELAAAMPISRQAAAKHLTVLEDAGLISAERTGRERRYALNPSRLRPATEWLSSVGQDWDARLSTLSRQLDPESSG